MAAVELKLHSYLIGNNRHFYSVTRGGNLGSRAPPSDHMTHYDWGGLHSIVSSATWRLLAHKQRTGPQCHRCDDDDKDHSGKYEVTSHNTSIGYTSTQNTDTWSDPPKAWVPVMSCSGFLPNGVAQSYAAACMPATAWSSRPQAPKRAKKEISANCAVMRCISCQTENNGSIRTWLPVLRSRSITRASLAKDERPSRVGHFRTGDAERSANRRPPYGYQPGQLRILTEAFSCATDDGVRGVSCARPQVCDLPVIETRQLMCARPREERSHTEDTFAIQLVEDCNTQTDGVTNDGQGKSCSGSKATSCRSVSRLPCIVSRPFVIRSAHSKMQHFNEKIVSSGTNQLRSLMGRSMSTTPCSP